MISQEKNEALGQRIRQLREDRGENQRVFGEKLGLKYGKGISPQRVAAWENGERPPVEKLIELGKLADNILDKKYFWNEAGIDIGEIERAARKLVFAEAKNEFSGQTISVPVVDTPNESIGKILEYICLPKIWIPNPGSTCCIELMEDAGLLPGPFAKGDFVIIDRSVRSLLHRGTCLMAIYFDPLPAGDLSNFHNRRREHLLVGKEYPGSGIRFGWPRLVTENEWLDRSIAKPNEQLQYRLLFQSPAVQMGGRQHGKIVPLTPWLQAPPRDETELKQHLNRNATVIGSVVGWIKSPTEGLG